MNAAQQSHPSENQLEAFGLGKLSADQLDQIAAHVEGCNHCCQILSRLRNDTLADLAQGVQVSEAATVTHEADSDPTGNRGAKRQPITIPPELRDHPRYKILRVIGSGGMGTVFKAEHRMMERTVALKVINKEYMSSSVAVERFRREVKAAARLSHPNIVTAFDADHADNLHFLVMEYVEGRSLDQVLRTNGPLPVSLACDFVAQTAEGLQHAQERKMIHRDIKPHNLMLTSSGTIKILDFGLARFAGESSDKTQIDQKGITAVDAVVGTPDYLPPEQARDSRSVDIRGDIYSLGGTLYHLLTGMPPFPSGSAMEKMLKHCEQEPPPLRQLRPDAPAAVESIVAKMLAKRREDRFQSPAEVIKALAPHRKASADHSKSLVQGAAPGMVAAIKSDRCDAPAKNLTSGTAPNRNKIIVRGLIALAIAAGILGAILLWNVMFSNGANRHPRVLFVLPQNGLWYPDYGPVRKILLENDIDVVIASSGLEDCQLFPNEKNKGKPVPVHVVLDGSVKAEDYDAIIFSGYEVAEFIGNAPAANNVRRLIKDMSASKDKWVTAVCAGQIILGKHGALAGKRVATAPDLENAKSTLGAKGNYSVGEVINRLKEGNRVVIDGHIITAGGPEDAEAFAEKLAKALKR